MVALTKDRPTKGQTRALRGAEAAKATRLALPLGQILNRRRLPPGRPHEIEMRIPTAAPQQRERLHTDIGGLYRRQHAQRH